MSTNRRPSGENCSACGPIPRRSRPQSQERTRRQLPRQRVRPAGAASASAAAAAARTGRTPPPRGSARPSRVDGALHPERRRTSPRGRSRRVCSSVSTREVRHPTGASTRSTQCSSTSVSSPTFTWRNRSRLWRSRLALGATATCSRRQDSGGTGRPHESAADVHARKPPTRIACVPCHGTVTSVNHPFRGRCITPRRRIAATWCGVRPAATNVESFATPSFAASTPSAIESARSQLDVCIPRSSAGCSANSADSRMPPLGRSRCRAEPPSFRSSGGPPTDQNS